MTSTAPPSANEADQRIVLYGWSWPEWRALLDLRGERSRPRMAYLDGAIELMTTSRGHEGKKSKIGSLVEIYCLEVDIPFSAYGEWTLDDESEEAGAEPDECYIFSRQPQAIERPQLVIEVNWSRGGVDKLEIYRRLRIQEVWFWEVGVIACFVLERDGYVARNQSALLPDLDLALVSRLATIEPTSDALKQMRELTRR